MRQDIGNGFFHDTGALTATNAAPSGASAGSGVPTPDSGQRPDAVSVVVAFTGGTSPTVEGVLYAYHATLGWIPSRTMLFGDGAAALADTVNRVTSGYKSVFLAPWMERVYLLLDVDNATGTPTNARGVVSVDEHREHL